MQNLRTGRLAAITFFAVVACARMAHGQTSGGLPTCTGWSNCNPGKGVCTFTNQQAYEGPTIVSDFPDGVSSDGRGRYIQGTDGVQWSIVVLGHAGLSLRYDTDSTTTPRTFIVNLSNPVPGGEGISSERLPPATTTTCIRHGDGTGVLPLALHDIPGSDRPWERIR